MVLRELAVGSLAAARAPTAAAALLARTSSKDPGHLGMYHALQNGNVSVAGIQAMVRWRGSCSY